MEIINSTKRKGLTFVETILVLLCVLFFITGGLLLKYDRPIMEKTDIKTDVISSKIEEKGKEPEKTTSLKSQ